MSISKLWEPLVDLLFQETRTFVPGEIVGIEFSHWSHTNLYISPMLIIGKAELRLANGSSVDTFMIRVSGPKQIQNLLDPTKPDFTDDEEWVESIQPLAPQLLFDAIRESVAELTNRYALGKDARFSVDGPEKVEAALLESGQFVYFETGEFSPIKPEVFQREPRFRVELE